jgi:hypothetical protein
MQIKSIIMYCLPSNLKDEHDSASTDTCNKTWISLIFTTYFKYILMFSMYNEIHDTKFMTLHCDICFVARYWANEFCLEMNEYQGQLVRYTKSNAHLKNMVLSGNSSILFFVTYGKCLPTVGSQRSTYFPPHCSQRVEYFMFNKWSIKYNVKKHTTLCHYTHWKIQ